jgi:hypothetical protein
MPGMSIHAGLGLWEVPGPTNFWAVIFVISPVYKKLGFSGPTSMRNGFEVSESVQGLASSNGPSNTFSWRAAFLGAAVGIAGSAYFGTLFSNVTLWVLLGQGRSTQEAYAYLGQYSLSFPVVISLVIAVCCALACGWVSAAYGRGAPASQGIAAGLLAVSFPIVMFLSPSSGEAPLLFKAIALGVPVLGSIVGAYLFARKS